jgi:hypothetical protein
MELRTHCKRGHLRTVENVGSRGRCLDCKTWRRRLWKPQRCGISELQLQGLISEGCPLCREPFRFAPHLDHDHRICPDKDHICTKCFRGVICDICNTGFIRAIEQRPFLRKLVAPSVLAYIDKLIS